MLKNKRKTLRKIMSDKKPVQKCAGFFVGKNRDRKIFTEVYVSEKAGFCRREIAVVIKFYMTITEKAVTKKVAAF